MRKLKIGTKLILLGRYHKRYTDITTDVIVKENKTTFSTKKKQLLKKDYNEARFNGYDSYNRKRVVCDVTKRTFHPDIVEIFNQKEYSLIVKIMNTYIADKKAKEEAYDLHKKIKEEAFFDFHKLSAQLYNDATPKLIDSFVRIVCSSCKNYQSDGTCKNDNDFYNVGVLSKSKIRWFGSMMTMCDWKAKTQTDKEKTK